MVIVVNMYVLLLYVGYVWFELNVGIGKLFVIIVFIIVLIVVNIVGFKVVMCLFDIILVLKLLFFVVFIVVGYW